MIRFLKVVLPIVMVWLVSLHQGVCQGPPITADKPIMLGSKTLVFKTLTEFRNFRNDDSAVRVPLMVHYVVDRNLLAVVHIPYVHYNLSDGNSQKKGDTFGDMELVAKYQFFRKDRTAKTLRMVVKTIQTFPTGKELDLEGMSTGLYQSYLGYVVGYETLKHGLSGEVGYNIVPNGNLDEFRFKGGFGLPLLKPTYPVNQLNLYFEYAYSYYPSRGETELLYNQGLQYAIDQLTLEVGVQTPLHQSNKEGRARKLSLYLGSRYIF